MYIRKRRGRWQVTIKHKDLKTSVKTFLSRKDAVLWGSKEEVRLTNTEAGLREKEYPKLKEALLRYVKEISIRKRSYEFEKKSILLIIKNEIELINLPLNKVSVEVLNKWRDRKLLKISGSSFNRTLDIISHLFTTCRKEWGYKIENPCLDFIRPKNNPPRNRRFTDLEINLLIKGNHTPNLISIFLELLLETGMRKGELLNVQRSHLEDNLLYIPVTKTKPRTIPISQRARELFNSIELPIRISRNNLNRAWRRLCRLYSIPNAKIHDLRHQALTDMMSKKGLNVQETMLISGHSSPNILLGIYSNITAREVAKKLN